MLKQRLLTAAVLVPLVVWALLALDSAIVLLLFAAVAALAAWEWLSLMGLSIPVKVTVIAIIEAVIFAAVLYLPLTVALLAMALLWLLATLLIVRYAHQPLSPCLQRLFQSPLFGSVMALFVLSGFVLAANAIHQYAEHGPALLLYVMAIVWLADTGGYFAGKRYGKHRLATAISPNKTWEGVAGALVLGSLWSIAFYYLLDDLAWPLMQWLALGCLAVLVSIVGDLFESVFKRCFDVKDSGQLLPGHGGILDRIDSLLAAVPVFAVMLLGLGVL